MAVGVKIVHRLLRPARGVKTFLVEENRDGVRVSIHDAYFQMVGVLPIQQAVPGIT